MSQRIAFTVSGIVQGVNFRSFTESKARSVGLTGYVRNESDGTVVGEAQGSTSALDKFIQHLNMGPSAAKVDKVEHINVEAKQGESTFDQIE